VIFWAVLLGAMLYFAAKLAMCLQMSMPNGGFKIVFFETMKEPFVLEAAGQTAALCAIAVVVWLVLLASYMVTYGKYMSGREHGSADWGDVKKLAGRYGQDENFILSQNMVIGMDMHKHQRNLNMLVIGGSGSGKTRFFSLPNLLQGNASYVVTDPKGEALRTMGGAMKNMGYDVRVFNLIEKMQSNRYNSFAYIRSDADILKLITNFIKNTTPKDSRTSDPFWDKAEMGLLQALVFYLYYEAPGYEQNFGMLVEMLRYAEVREEDDAYVSPLDKLFVNLEKKQPDHIAVKQYKLFKLAAGKTAKSILVSCGMRMAHFNIPEIARLTGYDEMRISDLAHRKVALFCVIPNSDSSMNFLVSMLYTQIINELELIADAQSNGMLPMHVRFMMDEFANVALPEDFEKTLSTCRSRNFSIDIIIQNIAQIKALFKDYWENITGNCDTLIYLGGNEQSTHEYISKSLGKATINYRTLGKSNSSMNTNVNITGRELMTPDEVRVMDRRDCLVFISGEKPIRDRKYDVQKKKYKMKLAALSDKEDVFSPERIDDFDEWAAVGGIENIEYLTEES
jgi:type IV secretion system protein VirD4